ncbi:MAG: stage V sporulation protein AD [Ruminococcaceae bacterium]|nr:stage V sporulation protein AD [Oscillospiraceae bacterium]
MQKGIIKLHDPPSIHSWACVGGEKEWEGPLGKYFDHIDLSGRFSMDTWEQAENEAQRLSFNFALKKGDLSPDDIDALYAGDLINQCTGSAYGLLSFDIPFFGIYGACSTSAEALTLGAIGIDSGHFKKCGAVCSSHFCSAERQFRYPLEYGNQRSPTSQWTVTAAASFILSKDGEGPYITHVLPGIVRDGGINDANNMGAAMAPAAVETLSRYFASSGKKPSFFDGIFTGDLGYEGHSIVIDLMHRSGYTLFDNYYDCGMLIYDRKRQDMHAGGSGCGCSASVLCTHILPKLKSGQWKNVLYIATGAMMSPASVQQGLSIPGIAHAIHISSRKDNK